MKRLFLLFFLIFIVGCSNNPVTFIEHIEGYWEIDEVTLNNGITRNYNYNDTIDFFEITDSLTGFRKKLKPNFSGTFETSRDAERFKLILENDSLNIYYTTPYSKWKETILSATNEQLIIINQNKDVYLYRRYQPIQID